MLIAWRVHNVIIMSEADKFLTLRTRVLHDLLVQLPPTAAGADRADGSTKLNARMLALLRQAKLYVNRPEATIAPSWDDLFIQAYIGLLTEKSVANRELRLLGIAALCVMNVEAIRRRKDIGKKR